jgi:hypothetical protein
MGSCCLQRDDADLHNLSQPTVSRMVHRVLRCLAEQRQNFIQFPSAQEIQEIHRNFFDKQGFPGVIGALDCTHVRILNPGGVDSELFRNRKGWFSINVQVLCDNNLMIRDIVASHKGSTHDSRIFNESTLKNRLERLPGRLHCLGDRGYACERFLLTPIANPRTAPERRYNFAHSSTRMVVERTFGIWKRFLPCLSKGLNFVPEKCAVLTVAAAVLYNFARLRNEVDDHDIEIDDADNNDYQHRVNAQGHAKRTVIIRDYYT